MILKIWPEGQKVFAQSFSIACISFPIVGCGQVSCGEEKISGMFFSRGKVTIVREITVGS